MSISRDQARAVPKVVLHDHLDGGLRTDTLIDLAGPAGLDLPTTDPDELAILFARGARRGNLELYLERFTHTVGVLQTAEALERVAREALEDLAADGVVYAELRFAPELNTAGGLTMRGAVQAALAGLADGPIPAGLIVDGMRTSPPEVVLGAARVALELADEGVVGFDLAGAEHFHPAGVHREALALVTAEGLPLTLHAGEAHGVAMVAEAVERFGARRIGHGVTLAQDIAPDGRLGPLARRVVELGVGIEACPTSNVHTSAVASLAEHPIGRFLAAGMRVSVNTDNRLMSDVTMSSEVHAVADLLDWTVDDAVALARSSMDQAFCDDATRTSVGATIDAWRG